jgi:hypothetical protein
MAPKQGDLARIAIQPTWVGVLDFETRFPSAIATAMSGANASPAGRSHQEMSEGG